MDVVPDVDKDVVSSKALPKETPTRESFRFEAMAQCKVSRDEADLVRFGKQQQLDVRDTLLCPTLPTSYESVLMLFL